MPDKGAMPWRAVAAFWMLVSIVYAAQIWWISQTPGEMVNLRQAITWQSAYFLMWIPVTLVVWRVTAVWTPETTGGWAGMLLRHTPVFFATAAVHFTVVALVAMVAGVARGGFWANVTWQIFGRTHLQLLIYTAAAGTGMALVMHRRFRERELATIKLEAELSAARLDALRGQLQPHFLFNSLHSIASLARAGDTAGVVRLIAGFSDILRHLLTNGERRLALREEMDLVERYLDIQRVRFADRLNVSIDIDPDVAEARVPLLVVQPLVENAVRHGLAPQVEPGTLSIRASRENGATRIDVADTGIGLAPGWSLAQSNGGTGLRNLASRLAAEFGSAASLEVVPRSGGGVVATVRVPFAIADRADGARS